MQKKQIYNPFLPLHEYIPDGEPHVFGDRVYHYGSHDKEGGYTFCMLDYVVYSAPVDDLTDWRYEGVSYRSEQDPAYPKLKFMYAPDVVKGNDGKFYLYYCMGGDYGYGGYTNPVSVAVSDSPAGPFSYLGHVKNPDGTLLMKYVCFDPGVLNDNGVIRLYYGTQYGYEERDDFETNPYYLNEEVSMFGRTAEEILAYRKEKESCPSGNPEDSDSINGPVMVVLEDDMLTVKEGPHHIIPYKVKGTAFEEHAFFEAPSMRKVGNKYYFIYSSWLNHELCYATSDYPDHDFEFQGTIVSNGDVGFHGRKTEDKLNMTGTTHGSIVEINGQWYVFYHRLTHKSDYSRQACAEKITIDENGKINQVEITSCGLNYGNLKAEPGMIYPAVIACNLTNGKMPYGSNSIYMSQFPNVTNDGDERFIGEIERGTLIGFKYFDCKDITGIEITARIETENNRVKYNGPVRQDIRSTTEDEASESKTTNNNESKSDIASKSQDAIYTNEIPEDKKALLSDRNYFEIRTEEFGKALSYIILDENEEWMKYSANLKIEGQKIPLYLVYHGDNKAQLKDFKFV